MSEQDETPLKQEDFDDLWKARDFKEIVRPSVTGQESLRFRRLLVEGQLAESQYEMVRWTKRAVYVALGAALLSVLVTLFLNLTRAASCV